MLREAHIDYSYALARSRDHRLDTRHTAALQDAEWLLAKWMKGVGNRDTPQNLSCGQR